MHPEISSAHSMIMPYEAVALIDLASARWATLFWLLPFTLMIYLTWKLWVYPEYFSPICNYPGPSAQAWFLGDERNVFSDEPGKWHKQWFQEHGPVVRYRGFAGKQVILTSDPKAISCMIMQKTSTFPKPADDTIGLEALTGRGLVTVEGDIHRRQRKIMSPSFTQVQTNTYLPVITEQAEKLAECLDKVISSQTYEEGPVLVNVCHWIGRATLEVISTAGFNYHAGSQVRDKHELIEAFNVILRPRQLTPLLLLTMRLVKKIPVLAKLPFPAIKTAKASLAIFWEEARKMLETKLEAIHADETEERDLLTSIMKANELAKCEKDKMKDDEILGTVLTFLVAGHETISAAIAFVLHELSLNKDVQDKLRMELKAAYHEAEQEGRSSLEVQELSSLPYLDAVVREILRIRPPLPLSGREAIVDEVLPLSRPFKGKDGRMISKLFVPAGHAVAVDVIALNTSKEIYGEDAEVFRPERWLENEGALQRALRAYCVWTPILSFWGGARSCTGYRFAILEMKAITSVLINKFEFSPGPSPITSRWNMVTRPMLENNLEEGPQLPLYIRKVEA